MKNTAQWWEIGKIVAPQGLRGLVRVYPLSDFPERFLVPGQRWLLRPGTLEPEGIQLERGYHLVQKNLYVLQLAGVGDRQQAEALRGAQLLVPAGDRPTLEDGEYHAMDLIGLTVIDQHTQTLVGTIVNVLTAGNDLLEVERPLLPEAVSPPTPEMASQAPHPDARRGGKIKARKAKASPQSGRILIPFVWEIVPVVDLQQGRVEITPPPGLLD